MRLNRQTDELIQDYIDGNLSLEKTALVKKLIETDPQAREAAEQYHLVSRSLFDLQPQTELQLDLNSDLFADTIMARLPKERRWVSLVKHDSLSLFVVLTIAAVMIWLVDLSAVSGWISSSLLPKFTATASVYDTVVQVAGRLNGTLPYLGFSMLVISFYGLLDRFISSSRRAI